MSKSIIRNIATFCFLFVDIGDETNFCQMATVSLVSVEEVVSEF